MGFYARTHYKVKHPKTYMDSGYQFNLGYAFPTALGAKVANPEGPTICMTGDGGFMDRRSVNGSLFTADYAHNANQLD